MFHTSKHSQSCFQDFKYAMITKNWWLKLLTVKSCINVYLLLFDKIIMSTIIMSTNICSLLFTPIFLSKKQHCNINKKYNKNRINGMWKVYLTEFYLSIKVYFIWVIMGFFIMVVARLWQLHLWQLSNCKIWNWSEPIIYCLNLSSHYINHTQ